MRVARIKKQFSNNAMSLGEDITKAVIGFSETLTSSVERIQNQAVLHIIERKP